MLQSNSPLDRRARAAQAKQQREQRLFFWRNVINGTFVVLASVAMIGLAVAWIGGKSARWCYALALVAIAVKMLDVFMRMPSMLRRPQEPQGLDERLSARERLEASFAQQQQEQAEQQQAQTEAEPQAPAEAHPQAENPSER